MMNPLSMTMLVKYQTQENMNAFHELNIMTSRDNIRGAFSLICRGNKNVARKIMKSGLHCDTARRGRVLDPRAGDHAGAGTLRALNARLRCAADSRAPRIMVRMHR